MSSPLSNLITKPRRIFYRFSLGSELQKALQPKQAPRARAPRDAHPLHSALLSSSTSPEAHEATVRQALASIDTDVNANRYSRTSHALLHAIIATQRRAPPPAEAALRHTLHAMHQQQIPLSIFYRQLLRMHLRRGDVAAALAAYEGSKGRGEALAPREYAQLFSAMGAEPRYFKAINGLLKDMKASERPVSTHMMNCLLPAWFLTFLEAMKSGARSVNLVRSAFSFLQRYHVKPDARTYQIMIYYAPTMGQVNDVRHMMLEDQLAPTLAIRQSVARTYFRLGEGLRVVQALQNRPYLHTDVTLRGLSDRTPFLSAAPIIPEISPDVPGAVVPALSNVVLQYSARFGYGPFLASTVWRTMEDMLYAPSKATCRRLLDTYQPSMQALAASAPHYEAVQGSFKYLDEVYPRAVQVQTIKRQWREMVAIHPHPGTPLLSKYLQVLSRYQLHEEMVQVLLQLDTYQVAPTAPLFRFVMTHAADSSVSAALHVAGALRRHLDQWSDEEMSQSLPQWTNQKIKQSVASKFFQKQASSDDQLSSPEQHLTKALTLLQKKKQKN